VRRRLDKAARRRPSTLGVLTLNGALSIDAGMISAESLFYGSGASNFAWQYAFALSNMVGSFVGGCAALASAMASLNDGKVIVPSVESWLVTKLDMLVSISVSFEIASSYTSFMVM
jgi:hypothetical protein